MAENALAGESAGDLVTATDADDDTLTYALAGPDAGAFDLDPATGQIRVRDALDFEARSSYSVTVTVHDGKDAASEEDAIVDDAIVDDAIIDDSIEVAISVTNVEEDGTVILGTETGTPEAGSAVTASLSDLDGGVTDLTWTWESSADRSAWDPIAGVEQDAYTPSEDDEGKYLRATASYADGHGPDKTAHGVTATAVAPPPERFETPGQNQAVTLTAPTAQTVAADWTYIPKDSSDNPLFTGGQSFRLLFLTSTTRNGQSTAIADYNTFVQERAATNSALTNADGTSFSGQFRALASTATVDARDNTATAPEGSSYTTGEGAPIYWLGGEKAADNYADFYDGNWDSRAARNESGTALSGFTTWSIWTGSKPHGTKSTLDYLGTSSNGVVGQLQLRKEIFAGFTISTSLSNSFYALSPVITVADTIRPAKPLDFRTFPNDGAAFLTWTDPSDGTITKYQYRQDGGAWRDITGNGPTTTAHTIYNLSKGTAYTFEIRAVDAGGAGPASDAVTATPEALIVPNNWEYLPSPGNDIGHTGQRFRVLFVTSTHVSGTSADIADYNTHVQDAANSSAALRPFKEQFRALVCPPPAWTPATTRAPRPWTAKPMPPARASPSSG